MNSCTETFSGTLPASNIGPCKETLPKRVSVSGGGYVYIYIYINYTDLYCRCLVLTAPEVYGWHIGSIQQPSGWQQSTPCFGPVRWAYLFRWGACKLAVGAPVIMFSTDLNWWIYIIHTCNVYIYIYISQSCIPASRSILECLSRWWVMKIIFFLEGPPTGLAIPYDEHLFLDVLLL